MNAACLARPALLAACLLGPGCQPAATRPAERPPARAAYAQSAGLAGASRVEWTLSPADGAFFSAPWPSELRRTEDGHLSLEGFPRARSAVVAPFVELAGRELDGFSIAPTIYFHFTAPPGAGRLPRSPADTRSASSPVFLVDIDPRSSELGSFVPLETRLYEGDFTFVPASTLALKPLPGFVLRPSTLYAAVVRRELGDAAGAELGTSDELEWIKATSPRPEPAVERARRLHEDALDRLAGLGVARGRIAAIALFRTQSITHVIERMLAVATGPQARYHPRLLSAAWLPRTQAEPPGPSVLKGYYCTPNFQSEIDHAPFLARRGGTVILDRSGTPEVQEIPESSKYRSEDCGPLMKARFVLSVPDGPVPAGGFPLLITAHGTGGDATSFLGERDFAGWAAQAGMAAASTNQPLHGAARDPGARPGSQEKVVLPVMGVPLPLGDLGPNQLFYNPVHPGAARDNMRQAIVDADVLLSLLAGADLESARRPGSGEPLLSPEPGRPTPRFSREQLFAAGHSQGAQSIAALGALEARLRGVILSGCGGDIRYGVLENREFAEVKELLSALLGLRPGELDAFHPLLAVVQMLGDSTDPESYARYYRDPLPGRSPQNVLHFEGLRDSYNPMVAAEALAVALRAVPLAPLGRPVPGLTLLGLAPLAGQVRGNAGLSTIAFAQLEPRHHEDGHFVIYGEPAAGELIVQFLRSLAGRPGPATVGPIQP